MTCSDAEAAIVTESAGRLDDRGRQALQAHLAACQACRTVRAAQLPVAAALGRRPPSPPPPDLTARVMARVRSKQGDTLLALADWRRWAEWALPVAAGLVLLAAVAGRQSDQSSTSPTAAVPAGVTVLEQWAVVGESEASPAATVLRRDRTTEEVLASLLALSGETTGGER